MCKLKNRLIDSLVKGTTYYSLIFTYTLSNALFCAKKGFMAPKSTLRLLSDDDVDKMASFDLDESYNLYDNRFGSFGSVNYECAICGLSGDRCLGHSGKLSLGCKIFHPLAYKKICQFVDTICFNCNKRQDAEQENNNRCTICNKLIYKNHCIAVYKEHTKFRSNNSSNDHLYCIARKHQQTRLNKTRNVYMTPEKVENILPKGYVISKILVPPINIRTPLDIEYVNDLHKLYKILIDLIKRHKELYGSFNPSRKPSSHEYMVNVSRLYERIVGSNKNEGIIGMLGTKSGIFRRIMQGKRVDKCARAVITPDPHLSLDQVSIPKRIASVIRVLENVSDDNIDNLLVLAENGRLWWQESGDVLVKPRHIVDGMTFYRELHNGDLVLFNRQPSLSRTSILCFKVKIKDCNSNTLGMNPQIVSPFNADFDGDEMNVFFGISNFSTQKELKELCSVSNNIIVDNTVSIKPIQDIITGCYLMSISDSAVADSVTRTCEMFYNRDTVQNYYTEISADKWGDYTEVVTTRSILRACIPGYNNETITKYTLMMYIKDSPDPLPMIERLQHVVIAWLSHRGLSVPLEIFDIDRSILLNKSDKDDYNDRCKTLVQTSLGNTDIMSMINSGAKGTSQHLQHMAAALGQQIIAGRPGVFCYESYTTGLTPDEFFGHQMAAREGVVKTGVSTSESGYLNRRSCKIMADVIVHTKGGIGDDYIISTFPQ